MATVANLEELIDDGLARARERVRIEAAYLFGSQLTDNADEDSDIDLAIFSPDVDPLNFVERVHLTSEISLNCDLRLQLHLLSFESARRGPAQQFLRSHCYARQTADLAG